MLRSMRVRMTVGFVVLLIGFGWILTRAISHSTQLLAHYDLVQQQHHIKLVLTTFMWLLFPAVALGAWIIIGRTLKPLRSLSQQAENSTGTRLVAPSSDKEMIDLVSTINGLLDRIEATAEAKTQFYGAASHELRTPLQALNGHIDTALSRERGEESYREALVEAQKQTQRLTTLTKDILTLHHLQAQHLTEGETADIGQSVTTALAEMEPLIEARGLKIIQDVPEHFVVHGRQTFADISVRNLVENAVRYATLNGNVSVIVTQQKVTITNDYVSNDVEDLEPFFEPFRSSNTTRSSAGGNGLGLAICRAAAHANRWNVRLESNIKEVTAMISFQ